MVRASWSRWPRRIIAWFLVLAVVAAVGMVLRSHYLSSPQDFPWTKLDLGQPIGSFTGRKLAQLTNDAAQCKQLLGQAGVNYDVMPPFGEDACQVSDAIRLQTGGSRSVGLTPRDVAPSCAVSAALSVWEWQVVQPAAERLLGSAVAEIRHYGSYSCRRIYGGTQGPWSEHATADAIDVAAFILADGRSVNVQRDWPGEGPESKFLREARDGACGLFSTVLSPEYNAAHADHFHLDMADRGFGGWRACR